MLFAGGHSAFAQPNLELDYPGLTFIPGQQILPQVISWFYRFALGAVGITALLVLVWAGLRYISSAADPSAQNDAKQWIWSAITGLLLLVASFFILNTINPNLTTLGVTPITPLITDTPGSDLYRACITEKVATCDDGLFIGIPCAVIACGCTVHAGSLKPLSCIEFDSISNTVVPECPVADNLCLILNSKTLGYPSNNNVRVCCPAP